MSKKILITGGTKGVGLAAVKIFASYEGYQVFALARDFSGFDISGVHTISFDLQNISGINKILEITGEIDVLVNNAAIMNPLNFFNYTDAMKNLILKINLEAPLELMSIYGKLMKNRGSGRIINIASVAGFIGHPDIWYGITKAGLLNATKSIAKQLAPYGVSVNSIAPGPINTSMLDTIPDERLAMFKNQAYDGKFAEPEEVAEIIRWLAVDAPSHITGACLDIHAGAFPR